MLIQSAYDALENLQNQNSLTKFLLRTNGLELVCAGDIAKRVFVYYTLENFKDCIVLITPQSEDVRKPLAPSFKKALRQFSEEGANFVLVCSALDLAELQLSNAATELRRSEVILLDESYPRKVLELRQQWNLPDNPIQLRNTRRLSSHWAAHFHCWDEARMVGVSSTHCQIDAYENWATLKGALYCKEMGYSRLAVFVTVNPSMLSLAPYFSQCGVEELYILSSFLSPTDPTLIELVRLHEAEPTRYPFINLLSWEEGIHAGIVNRTRIEQPAESVYKQASVTVGNIQVGEASQQ